MQNKQNSGLTDFEVLERRKRFGLNVLPEQKGRTALEIYISQYKSPLIYIVLIAGMISFILGEYEDVYIIIAVVLVDSFLGLYQEYQAEKAVVALKRLLKPTATVIRDGKKTEIDVSEVVPDDLIVLFDGARIPADGKFTEVVHLTVNEAILTGESEPIAKNLDDPAYMGTTVFSGRGQIKVTSTGKSTELGKIAGSLSEMKTEETPLQVRLRKFSSLLTYLVIAISICVFVVGILSGIGLLETLEISIVLAIAAIPEGLLIAITMILAVGMRSILRRKGLVKRLLAVETLGSVTVICTDKTGTLTEGIMRVVKTDFRFDKMAAYVLTLCNNLADSLEAALWNHIKGSGEDPENISKKYERVFEIPFTSEKKYMLTVHNIDGDEIGLLKGAPEVVLESCDVTLKEKEEIMAKLEEWASSGLKLLGLAYKDRDKPSELSGFTWLGLVGIEDPVRPSVKDAISLCRKAGIKVKIITGDYRGTAEKVATSLGLPVEPNRVIDGKQLEALSESQLANIIDDVTIFCRVSPSQKLKIVSALQSRKEVVAMIGDGVNDAPALKKSNIGVSVGNATDVAQETASLILMDNNFATLVNAVEEGRIVFENIKKVVAFVLSNSFAEIITIVGAMILGWPAPLSVGQILWIHLICDGPSDIALGFEREEGLMNEPPKRLDESILDKYGAFLISLISVASAVVSLLLFWYFWKIDGDIVLGRTIVFTVLAISNLVYIFSYRHLHASIFRSKHFFSNKFLFVTVFFGFAQQIAALYIPFLSNILGVKPLQLTDWALIFGICFGMMFIVEWVKHSFWKSDRKNRENQ